MVLFYFLSIAILLISIKTEICILTLKTKIPGVCLTHKYLTAHFP